MRSFFLLSVVPAWSGMGKGGAGALISISYNYDALEEFVASVKNRFKEHEDRIVALEQQQTALAGKNAVLERTLQQREEEIRVLRGECKQLAQQAVEVEEQNQALREENALAFTKIYKKLESSSTSEGLQKEMMSLKEGTDNRMLVLENLMREIGGDKMKTLIGDVSQVQTDIVSLWSENARMILEVECRAHNDQIEHLHTDMCKLEEEVKGIKVFTSDSAQAARRAELETLRDAVGKVMNETEVNSRLVRACVERTDQTVMAKAETDRNVESLRTELGNQNKGLGEAQNLVRALLGAQKRFAVELDSLGSNVRSSNARSPNADGAGPVRPHSAMPGGVDRPGSPDSDLRASTSLGFSQGGGGIPHFPPGKVRRPQSALSFSQSQAQHRQGSARPQDNIFNSDAKKQQRAAAAKLAGASSVHGGKSHLHPLPSEFPVAS
jgi:hypothetical protein